MSNLKQSAATCVVSGKPVATHKYVQVIPFVDAPDDATGKDVVKHAETGRKHRLPKFDERARIDGKRFVSLNAPLDKIMAALKLDDDAIYELRHKPPRHVVRIDLADIATMRPNDPRVVLQDGRHCQLRGIEDGKAEVDFGVLLKVRCFGRQAKAIIADWQAKLTEQLMS